MAKEDSSVISNSATLDAVRHLKYLPAFARYILDNHLQAIAASLLRLAHELDVPLLRYFASMPEEELLAMGVESNKKLLTSLIKNDAAGYLEDSLQTWTTNQV